MDGGAVRRRTVLGLAVAAVATLGTRPAAAAPGAYWVLSYVSGSRRYGFDPRGRYVPMRGLPRLVPSPDGSWTAVLDGSRMGLVRSARLTSDPVFRLPAADVVWHPDGQRLLAVSGSPGPVRLTVLTLPSVVRSVTLAGSGASFESGVTLGWAGDGFRFATVDRMPGRAGATRVWTYSADGRASGSSTIGGGDLVGLSPDGRWALMRDQVRSLDGDAVRSRPAGRAEWLADGRLLAYGPGVVRVLDPSSGALLGSRSVAYRDVTVVPVRGSAPAGAITV